MQDLQQTQVKLKWWPSPQDYNEAIQSPAVSLSDPQLRNGALYVDAIGLPKAACGAFASVYRMRTETKDYALRCFLRDVAEQEERYALISEYVQSDDLPYTVNFDYQRGGIRINGTALPLLKMDWVSGLTLDFYVGAHFRDSERIAALAAKFLTMSKHMRRNGIAHGDLQHGNIILCHDEIRLVDYDGMYVPSMTDYSSTELGHRNYQHPGRGGEHFGPYLDNFSDWVLYTSLRAIALDPELFLKFKGGDECILFRRDDFLEPAKSDLFRSLEHHQESEIRMLTRFLRAQLASRVQDIPALTDTVPVVELDDLSPPDLVSHVENVATPSWLTDASFLAEEERQQNNLPDWMTGDGGTFAKPAVVRKKSPPWDLSIYEPELCSMDRELTTYTDSNVASGIVLVIISALMMCVPFWPTMLLGLFLMVGALKLLGSVNHTMNGVVELVARGNLAKTSQLIAAKDEHGWYAQYEFTAVDGKTYSGSTQINKVLYDALVLDVSPITVLYDAKNPDRSILYKYCGLKAYKTYLIM